MPQQDEKIVPLQSIEKDYKPLEDLDELHFSEIFSTIANVGLDGNAFKVFQRIPLSSEISVLGDPCTKNIKTSFSKLISENGETRIPIFYLQARVVHFLSASAYVLNAFATATGFSIQGKWPASLIDWKWIFSRENL